jgi:hypothetical protein
MKRQSGGWLNEDSFDENGYFDSHDHLEYGGTPYWCKTCNKRYAHIADAFTCCKEVDPNGVEQHDPGAKLDSGKPDCSLLGMFGLALIAVAEVGTHGAAKYTRGGWQHVVDGINRYTAAMMRHYLKEQFEETDNDIPVKHAAQVAWNALARLELMLRKEAGYRNKEDTPVANGVPIEPSLPCRNFTRQRGSDKDAQGAAPTLREALPTGDGARTDLRKNIDLESGKPWRCVWTKGGVHKYDVGATTHRLVVPRDSYNENSTKQRWPVPDRTVLGQRR